MEEAQAWDEVQYSPKDRLQAYFWLRNAELLGHELTALELSDAPSETAFTRPPRETWDMSYLATFLTDSLPELKAKNTPRGVLAIILARSAVRVIDIFKSLKQLGRHIEVGKLFAKHTSVEEQSEYLATKHPRIVVGTPGRIQVLIDNNSLSLEHCKLVIIDMQKDVKNYSLLDTKDTGYEFFKLYHMHFHSKVKQNLRLVLF